MIRAELGRAGDGRQIRLDRLEPRGEAIGQRQVAEPLAVDGAHREPRQEGHAEHVAGVDLGEIDGAPWAW